MLDGGIFISLRIDHIRGLFASDDHASLQVTLDKNGNITQASSSMAFQGKKITSDVIRLGAGASTNLVPLQNVAKVGTDLLADLTSKLMQENVAEPGRVTFPAVIHHNYNLLCLATGLVEEPPAQTATPATEENSKPAPAGHGEPCQKPLHLDADKNSKKKIGDQTLNLPVPGQ